MGYDGISIELRSKGRWLYRVYDRQSRRRRSRTFRRGAEDEHRHVAGCAAGDRWAADTRAQFQLRLDRAGALPVLGVLDEYLGTLEDAGRSAAHRADIDRVVRDLVVRGGVTDLRAPDLLGKVEAWRRGMAKRSRAVPHQRNREPGSESRPAKLQREARLSPVTLNRYLVLVRSLVHFAVDRGMLMRDPLAPIRALEAEDPVKPIFTVPEVRTILARRAVDDAGWWWVALMLLTGARPSEALGVQHGDISEHVLLIRDHKRRRQRVVPLHPALRTVLSWHPGPGTATTHLVAEAALRAANSKTFGLRFATVLQESGITRGERTAHSCRHTVAALLTATQASAFQVADWLGHAQLETTRHYSREAATVRPVIEQEGWKPGELRLL